MGLSISSRYSVDPKMKKKEGIRIIEPDFVIKSQIRSR
jgi:hypothetical protein